MKIRTQTEAIATLHRNVMELYISDHPLDCLTFSANGDCEIFARQFMSIEYLEEGGLEALFYETEIRRKHTKNFLRTFSRLMRLAGGCDVDGIISDSLRQSAFGLLVDRMQSYEPNASNSTAA